MLREHLSQEHDAASRRAVKIDAHVAWIHGHILAGRSQARVLDLGCGPGLYSSRLARLGHACVGIDYSPASIAYAREQAAKEGLPVRYELADIREAEYGAADPGAADLGAPFDLAMLLYGEPNVFRREHALRILRKAHAALAPGGLLLLEPHHWAAIERMGREGRSWWSSSTSVYASAPHIVLQESFWTPEDGIATIRYYVLDGATGMVTRFAQSLQAYTAEGYAALMAEAGFVDATTYPSLNGQPDASQADMFALVARKPS
jgi:SAM-dependent methyltransferase